MYGSRRDRSVPVQGPAPSPRAEIRRRGRLRRVCGVGTRVGACVVGVLAASLWHLPEASWHVRDPSFAESRLIPLVFVSPGSRVPSAADSLVSHKTHETGLVSSVLWAQEAAYPHSGAEKFSAVSSHPPVVPAGCEPINPPVTPIPTVPLHCRRGSALSAATLARRFSTAL